MSQVIQTLEQQHYFSKLLGFSYTIIYKLGKDNRIADPLFPISETDDLSQLDRSFGPLSNLYFNLIYTSKVENLTRPILLTVHQSLRDDTNSDSSFTEMVYLL